MKIVSHCDYCGKRGETTYPHKKFCSAEHRRAFNAIVDRNAAMVLRVVRESVREIVRARNQSDHTEEVNVPCMNDKSSSDT